MIPPSSFAASFQLDVTDNTSFKTAYAARVGNSLKDKIVSGQDVLINKFVFCLVLNIQTLSGSALGSQFLASDGRPAILISSAPPLSAL